MKNISRLLSALLILLVESLPAHALLAGASPDSPAARIDANTASSPWAGVGSISIGGNAYTGALIAPGYVLTAGHVVYGVAPGNITFNLNAGGDMTQSIVATAVYTAPGFNGFDPNHLGNDLAIVKLAQPMAGDVPTYGILRDAMPVGTTLTFVGYGASGNGDIGVTTGANPALKRVGQNNADMFQLDAGGKPAVYYFDFDGPDASTNFMGGVTLGNSTETTVGGGDSGSPAFYEDADGHVWLAGINTFSLKFSSNQVTGTFGTGGGGQVLSAYSTWIDSVVTPVPEPASWPMMLGGLVLLGWIGSRRGST